MVVSIKEKSVERSVTALGWFHLAYGTLLTGAAVVWAVASTLIEMMFHQPGTFFVEPVSAIAGLSLILFSALPSLIAGYGLLDKAEWARAFARRLCFVNMVVVPFGTALGIWTHYTLRTPTAEKVFRPQHSTVAIQ